MCYMICKVSSRSEGKRCRLSINVTMYLYLGAGGGGGGYKVYLYVTKVIGVCKGVWVCFLQFHFIIPQSWLKP